MEKNLGLKLEKRDQLMPIIVIDKSTEFQPKIIANEDGEKNYNSGWRSSMEISKRLWIGIVLGGDTLLRRFLQPAEQTV